MSPFVTPEPGQYWFSAICKTCGALIPFSPDPSNGERNIKMTVVEGHEELRCRACGTTDNYGTDEGASRPIPKTE